MAYQIVNDGIQHWFSTAGDAVVGYVQAHGVCIVAGAPICDAARLGDVLTEWEAFVRRIGCRTCYFGAAGRVFDALHRLRGYSTVVLGAQPVWHPARWAEIPAGAPSLRGQMSRARNKGVRVSEWSPEQATADRGLGECLAAWLGTRRLPVLHFLVEPNTLHDLVGRRIFVAERNARVVGFLNVSPIPARHGWLIEQFVRSDRAPNGTIELLIDTMMRAVAADGAEYVTMGLVPLREGNTSHSSGNPAWLATVISMTRIHGRRFYDFGSVPQLRCYAAASVANPSSGSARARLQSFAAAGLGGDRTREPNGRRLFGLDRACGSRVPDSPQRPDQSRRPRVSTARAARARVSASVPRSGPAGSSDGFASRSAPPYDIGNA